MLGKEGISQKAQLKEKAMLLAVLLGPGGGGGLPYLTLRDVPLNRVSFF